MIFDIFIFTYGAYSSAVERQIVDLVVVGSIPTRHPFIFNAPVAHLDRAPDFESGGRRFESSQTQPMGAHQYELLFFLLQISYSMIKLTYDNKS